MKIDRICKFFGSLFKTKEKSPEKQETEKCVLCGKDTEIPISSLITNRRYYITGCGQLCKECYKSLESESVSEKAFSDTDMELLLQLSQTSDSKQQFDN